MFKVSVRNVSIDSENSIKICYVVRRIQSTNSHTTRIFIFYFKIISNTSCKESFIGSALLLAIDGNNNTTKLNNRYAC